MAIKRRRIGGHVYLYRYESVREGKKVKSNFVEYLGREDRVEAGVKPNRVIDEVRPHSSTRAGAVRVLWRLCEDLGFIDIIDRICGSESAVPGMSPGHLLSAWAINRVIDQHSVTQMVPWLATTDLPDLMEISPDSFNRDRFYDALDAIVHPDLATGLLVDHTREIDRALYEHWRKANPLPGKSKETLAYDITSVMFFGATCPLAELGYNARKDVRSQVNLSLVVSRHDRMPMLHLAFPGNRNGKKTVRSMLAELSRVKVNPGLLIWDRGNMGRQQILDARDMGWHLLGGVAKTGQAIREIVGTAGIDPAPSNLVRESNVGMIYATATYGKLWGQDRRLIVYMNDERALRDRSRRNRALLRKRKALEALAKEGQDWGEAQLHERIASIIGSDDDYLEAHVSRDGSGPRIVWRYKTRAVNVESKQDGKWLLLCTDDRLSVEDVVNLYLEKDFVEKSFRLLKTDVDLEPVRHRLEHRVRAYLFVSMLAHRLWTALRWRLLASGLKEGEVAKYLSDLLEALERVERVVVQGKKTIRVWYLNENDLVKDGVRRLRMKGVFPETTRQGTV